MTSETRYPVVVMLPATAIERLAQVAADFTDAPMPDGWTAEMAVGGQLLTLALGERTET